MSDSLHFRQLHEAMEAHRQTNAKLRDRVSELEEALRSLVVLIDEAGMYGINKRGPCVDAARKVLEVKP